MKDYEIGLIVMVLLVLGMLALKGRQDSAWKIAHGFHWVQEVPGHWEAGK